MAAGQEFLADLSGAWTSVGESAMRALIVARIKQPTAQSARLVDGKLELLETYKGLENDAGDGTVPSFALRPGGKGPDGTGSISGTTTSTATTPC
ncbi:MAG TPA: hypothetical protein VK975_05855 [Acidimicrobiales bacterium]|nr:hypothetical protein [Acidimicrobiales bacterium]